MMIVSNANEVLLTMNISGREFAKAKLMQYLNDPGYIVSFLADGSCVFNPWCFNGTKEEGETIYMTGPAFEGLTFLLILTDPSHSKKRIDAFERIRSAVEQSFEQNITLPLCGPVGTLIAQDGSILFLPQEYIQRSVSFLDDKEASTLYGCYHRGGLSHTDSLRFTLSVYAYEIITQRLPFQKKNTNERIEDYIDSNFIPAHFWNPCISKEYTDILSHNLRIPTKIRQAKKKNKKTREDVFESKSLALPSLDLHIHETDIENSKEHENTCAQERYAFISSQTRKVKTKRFFRQKGNLVTIFATVSILIFIIAYSFIIENKNKPSTIGLSPFQVTESFYTSLNELDVELTSITTIRSFDKGFKNMISSLHVINKLRTAYDPSCQILHPGQWLLNNRNFADWMFGVTNFTINDIPANCFSNYHKTDIQRLPLHEENGAKETFLVSYFLVRHESNADIAVTQYKETVELEFRKDRWLITAINSEDSEFYVPTTELYNDIRSFDDSIDVYERSAILSSTYFWMPTAQEIYKAIEVLKEHYASYAF